MVGTCHVPHVADLGLTTALSQAEITVQSPVGHVLKDIPPPFIMKLSFISWSDVDAPSPQISSHQVFYQSEWCMYTLEISLSCRVDLANWPLYPNLVIIAQRNWTADVLTLLLISSLSAHGVAPGGAWRHFEEHLMIPWPLNANQNSILAQLDQDKYHTRVRVLVFFCCS